MQLYCDDCINIMRAMPDKSVDLCLTDPPYGIGMDKGFNGWCGAKSKKYDDQWDKERPNKEYFDEMLRVSKNLIIFGGNYFADLLPPATKWIVWDKKCGIKFNNPFSDAELLWTSFPGGTKIEYFLQQGFVKQSDDIRYHPTQKPTELIQRLLCAYSKPGETILDCFMGSGSTGVACVREKRNFIGIEREEKYYIISKKRIEEELDADEQLSLI